MKKYKLLNLTILFFLFGFLLTGCDENMPVVQEVGVESITLNEELVNGITLEKGATANISWKVTLTPENATDRAENYSTSNPEIATVSAGGEVTANEVGTCDIIITVGGESVKFLLTVTPIAIIPIENIILAVTSPFDLKFGETFDLSEQIGVEPINSNDELVYTTSNPEIVTVSNAGLLESINFGIATITVAAKSNPSIKAELIVNVGKLEYPREGWVMTTSHGLPLTSGNPEGNSFTAALDGNFSTNLSMVRPTKTYGTDPNRISVLSGEALHFTVNMQEPKEINYFRIRHRDTSQLFLRWYGFDQILGSNDGENFEVITTDVVVTNAAVSDIESPDISIPKSTYQYIRFYAKEAKCFYQSSYTSQGSTIQIQELYLGLGD